MNPLAEITFRLAKPRVLRLQASSGTGHAEATDRLDSVSVYDSWRDNACSAEFERGFSSDLIAEKAVLEFGCGLGAFSRYLAEIGARRVLGTDLNREFIEHATTHWQSPKVSFFHATDPTQIDLPDNSIDVITCFDVMEHIMDYREVIAEWHRVLTDDGIVLIAWEPYYSPYGHHSFRYIPLPWIHVYLSDHHQNNICARIVDLPEFDPPWWDQDESGKKINRFHDWNPQGPGYLNKLTMRKFEKICKQNRLRVEKRDLRTFRGSWLASVVGGALIRAPIAREYFTSMAFYTLRKG